jgi:hypothetical protein
MTSCQEYTVEWRIEKGADLIVTNWTYVETAREFMKDLRVHGCLDVRMDKIKRGVLPMKEKLAEFGYRVAGVFMWLSAIGLALVFIAMVLGVGGVK